jgi:SanA protein
MKMRTLGITGIIFSLLLLTLLLLLYFSDRCISRSVHSRLYTDVEDVPVVKTALVLGTSRYRPGGRVNLYFRYRLDAAVLLLEQGTVRYLLVSGDNARDNYNEPLEMKKALIEMGVPSERIILDYAGFRTLDSVVRCSEVFGQDRFVIVSQKFHNERALYIAEQFGIDAVAFNARDVGGSSGTKVRMREYFARVKALLDLHIIKTGPRFLGDAVTIPD